MPATEPLETLARIQDASFARASEATRSSFPPERRMDGPVLTAFLTARRYAVLATTRPDGRPQAAPVGYALVGTQFIIGSLADAARVRNLRHQPHTSLVVTQGEGDEHGMVIAEGTARLLDPAPASLEMRAPFRGADGRVLPWVGVLIAIHPARLLSYAGTRFRAG
jgi:PPOX class probable F420-dependent enzyme